MAKNQAKAKENSEAELLWFENFSLSSYHPKIIGNILKSIPKASLFKWDYVTNGNENETENEK